MTQLLGIKTAFYTHLLSKMYMKIPKLYLATATAQQLGKVVGSGSGWRSLQRLIFFLSTFLSMPDELHRVLPSSLRHRVVVAVVVVVVVVVVV